ncbi:hypothetical protein [Serratia marcescens]|nr:hypothetical protein [Serratia marcescens]
MFSRGCVLQPIQARRRPWWFRLMGLRG